MFNATGSQGAGTNSSSPFSSFNVFQQNRQKSGNNWEASQGATNTQPNTNVGFFANNQQSNASNQSHNAFNGRNNNGPSTEQNPFQNRNQRQQRRGSAHPARGGKQGRGGSQNFNNTNAHNTQKNDKNPFASQFMGQQPASPFVLQQNTQLNGAKPSSPFFTPPNSTQHPGNNSNGATSIPFKSDSNNGFMTGNFNKPFQQTSVDALISIPSLPTQPGFRQRVKPPTLPPVYLEEGAPSFTRIERQPDPWDLQNQQEMAGLEQLRYQGVDLETLYKKFQDMRENERREMESRGLVDRQNVSKSLKDAICFVGTCRDKCPTFERIRRSYELDTKTFERDDSGNASRELAVKAFSRPAAGQPPPLPSDVRPPDVLITTLHYLIDNIIPQLPKSHTFLWDRTRSIRQDFTYQNYIGREAIFCNELIVRIHILSLHIMLTSDVEYSKQQEIEQLNKALQTLSELYSENRKIDPGFRSPREAEFRAYQLLSHIYDPDIPMQIQALPRDVYNAPELQLALTLRTQVQYISRSNSDNPMNLFASFFISLTQNTQIPFLFLCLLETHFQNIRTNALAAMSKAYHPRGSPYIVPRLTAMLGFDSDHDTITFCTHYGLKLEEDKQYGPCIVVTISPQNLMPGTSSLAPFKATFIDARKGGKSWSDCVYEDPKVSASTFISKSAINILNKVQPGVFQGQSTVFQTKPTFEERQAPKQTFSQPAIPQSNAPSPIFSQFPSKVSSFGQPQESSALSSEQQNQSPLQFFNPPSQRNPVQSVTNQLKPSLTPQNFQTQSKLGISSFSPPVSSSLHSLSAGPPSQAQVPLHTQPSKLAFPTSNSFGTPVQLQPASKQPNVAFDFGSFSSNASKPSTTSLIDVSSSRKPLVPEPVPKPVSREPLANLTQSRNSGIVSKPQLFSASNNIPKEPVSLPISPPKPRFTYTDEDVSLESKRVMKLFVLRTLRESIIPGAWNKIQASREERKTQQKEACDKVMKMLVHDILVDRCMVASAKKLDSQRLKKLVITGIMKTSKVALKKQDEKKKRLEEYERVTLQLGRPRVSSAGVYANSPVTLSRSGSNDSISSLTSNTHSGAIISKRSSQLQGQSPIPINAFSPQNRKTTISRITTIHQVAQNLWEPLDIKSIAFPSLEYGLRRAQIFGPVTLKFCGFCRDWDTVAGKWVKTKLALQNNSENLAKDDNGITSVNGSTTLILEQLQADPATYENISQIAFVCGLDVNGMPSVSSTSNSEDVLTSYDCDALSAVLDRVLPVCVYKPQLLVISWSNLDKQQVLLRLGVKKYEEYLSGVTFCCISESYGNRHTTSHNNNLLFDSPSRQSQEKTVVDPTSELEEGVKTLFSKFSAEYSARGKINHERKQAHDRQVRESESRRHEIERLSAIQQEQELEREARRQKLRNIGSLRSSSVSLSPAKRKHDYAGSNTPVRAPLLNGVSPFQPKLWLTPSPSTGLNTPNSRSIFSTPLTSRKSLMESASKVENDSDLKIPKGVKELKDLILSVKKRRLFQNNSDPALLDSPKINRASTFERKEHMP